jgi:hypothetical protein
MGTAFRGMLLTLKLQGCCLAARSILLICLIMLAGCAGTGNGTPSVARNMSAEEAMAIIRSYYARFPGEHDCSYDEQLNQYNRHEELVTIDQAHMVVHYYGDRKVPIGPFRVSGRAADNSIVDYSAPAKYEKYDGQVEIRFANILGVVPGTFVVAVNFKGDDGQGKYYDLYPACTKESPLALTSALLSLSPNAR